MLTHRNSHIDTSRPTLRFCRLIRTLLWNAGELPGELQQDFKLLEIVSKDLFRSIDAEEKQRPEFQFNFSLYKKQEELQLALDEEKKHYEKRLIEHEKKLIFLEEQIKNIDHKISATRDKTLLEDLKNLVNSNELHLELEEEINLLRSEFKSNSSCTKYIFTCLMNKEIQDTKYKISKLKIQRKKIQSDEPASLSAAIITALSIQREKIENKRAKLAHNPPLMMDEDLLEELAEIKETIDEGEIKHYTAISNESMYHIIRTYELYSHLSNRLTSPDFSYLHIPISIAAFTNLSRLKKLFIESHEQIENIFIQFWCPHSNNNSSEYFYQQFLQYADSDQYRIISNAETTIDEINALVPFHEIESIIIGYHPIGISRRLPINCSAFRRRA